MLRKNNQEQQGGENSTNVLAGNDVNFQQNNYGLSYSEVKEVVLDLFDSNFYKLSLTAQDVAKERAEEITNAFLDNLRQKAPEAIDSMKEPDMQYALLMAQKEYARTGDENLSEMLVDILVERSKVQERSLLQIVLNESLEVVPKLTNAQLNILSLIFIIRYSINHAVNSFDSLRSYLEQMIVPFMADLTKKHSSYQHLEYAGCGTISIGSSNFLEILKKNYGGLFTKGFTLSKFNDEFGEDSSTHNLLVTCLHDPALFQINAMNEEVLIDTCKSLSISDEEITKIKSLQTQSIMTDDEVWNFLVELCPDIRNLKDIWTDSPMKSMSLTSVGIALAHANIRRKTNQNLELSIWI